MFRSEYWYRFPWLLMAAAMALVVVGVAGIHSASGGGFGSRPLADLLLHTFWGKQIVWVLVGLVVFAAALMPSYTRLAGLSYPLYLLTVAALAVLAVMRAKGMTLRPFIYPTNNAYSWIHLPGISFQPSELTKIGFVMALAYYLRYRRNVRTLRGLVLPFIMALVPTGLVLYQPDLGTAMLFLPVLLLMLFAAGAKTRHLLAVLAVGLLLVPLFYLSLKGYQRLRIDSWLLNPCAERLHFALREADREARRGAEDEDASSVAARARITDDEKTRLAREVTGMWRFRLWRLAARLSWTRSPSASSVAREFDTARERLFESLRDERGPGTFDALRRFFDMMLQRAGYQQWQMQVAVGSGRWLGRGWGQGTQTRYLLPEAQADSLFAVIGEEFGFLGAGGVVVLFGLLFVLGIDVSFSTTEPYGKLVVVGVVALFASQSFLNIAMCMGLAPVTGIPLPLMSYGGSSMVSSFLALGLLCNVAVRRLFLIAPRPFEWR